MHTVTKVLVVFAAILCVLLAALTMAYSVNAERITADYRTQVNEKLAAVQSSSADVTQAHAATQAKQEQIDTLRSQLTALSNQIQSLESELSTKRSEVNQAKLAADDKTAQLNQLATTSNTQAELIKTYRGEVTKLRDNELTYRKREIELVDRLNDLESQREVQDGSIRALQETLAELQRNVGGGATPNGAPAGLGAPFTPQIAISGKVLQVGQNKATQRPIATINVGANNQVKENMKLAISRNGQFLGNFVVTKADLQWSVGEIDTLGKKVDIREGDSVGTLVSR